MKLMVALLLNVIQLLLLCYGSLSTFVVVVVVLLIALA